MKKIELILAVLLGFLGTAVALPQGPVITGPAAIGQRIPHFTAEAWDMRGATPSKGVLDSLKSKRATVYIFVGTHCPATQAYAERLTQLDGAYAKKGVDFVFLYPNRDDTLDAATAFHKEKQFKGRLIKDDEGKLAHLLGAQRTSELFLTDRKGTVVYHGAIDDSREVSQVKQHFLTMALDATLAGKPVSITESNVVA